MTTFTYTGFTAFIKNTPQTTDAFRALAEAIPQIQPYTGLSDDSYELFEDIMDSAAFRYTQSNHEMLSPCRSMFPKYTPKELWTAELSSECIDDVYMTRLYLPAAAADVRTLGHLLNNCIHPVLNALFGEDIVSITTKTATENDEFHLAKETVLLSAQRQAALA